MCSHNNKCKNIVNTVYCIDSHVLGVVRCYGLLKNILHALNVLLKDPSPLYNISHISVKKDYTILAKGQRPSRSVGTISCALPASPQHKQWAGFKPQFGNIGSVVRSRKPDQEVKELRAILFLRE